MLCFFVSLSQVRVCVVSNDENKKIDANGLLTHPHRALSSLLLTTLLFSKRSEEEIDGAVPYGHQHTHQIHHKAHEGVLFLSIHNHVPNILRSGIVIDCTQPYGGILSLSRCCRICTTHIRCSLGGSGEHHHHHGAGRGEK